MPVLRRGLSRVPRHRGFRGDSLGGSTGPTRSQTDPIPAHMRLPWGAGHRDRPGSTEADSEGDVFPRLLGPSASGEVPLPEAALPHSAGAGAGRVERVSGDPPRRTATDRGSPPAAVYPDPGTKPGGEALADG